MWLKWDVVGNASGQHAGGAPAIGRPQIPEPSYAERARTLIYLGRIGTLSSISRKQPGWPFGSVMPYALDEEGRPVFLISAMAMHTHNIQADPRVSLLVAQTESEGDPLGASRVTLLGKVSPIPKDMAISVRERYLIRYENARYWVDFDDFAFYRMELVDVYFVGGFGVMGWVDAADYMRAESDPLADAAHDVIQHMNTGHADALVLLAHFFAGTAAEEARMTSVDRLGFHVRLKSGGRVHGARIPFIREVRNTPEARKVLVEMVQQARRS